MSVLVMGIASSRRHPCASALCSPVRPRGSGDEQRMLLPQVSPHPVTVERNSEANSAIVMSDDRGSSLLPIRPTTSLVSFCQDSRGWLLSRLVTLAVGYSRGWFRFADLSRRATTRCKRPKEDQPLFRRRARGPPHSSFFTSLSSRGMARRVSDRAAPGAICPWRVSPEAARGSELR